MNLLNS